MDVYMIWATNNGSNLGDGVWLVDAWDEDTISENPEGWAEKKALAFENHGGPENVRVTKVRVDIDKVLAAFDVPEVGA